MAGPTRAELMATIEAEGLDVTVTSGDTNATILAKIETARADATEPVQDVPNGAPDCFGNHESSPKCRACGIWQECDRA